MGNKLIIAVFLSIFLIFFVSSTVVELGDGFKKNECIDLTQTCSNCTYVNLSFVQLPNSTKIIYDLSMTKNGILYTYEFCNTSQLGTYVYGTYGNPDGELSNQNVEFVVTPNGEKPQTSKSIIYISLLAIFLLLLLINMYMILISGSIEWKVGYLSTFYLFSNVFLLVSWKLSESFLTSIPFLEIFFRILWFLSTIIMFPFFIIMFLYLMVSMTNSWNEKRLRKRGYSDEQILRRRKRQR